jgi:hypothetical protein
VSIKNNDTQRRKPIFIQYLQEGGEGIEKKTIT